jgi:hypothetical protein
MVNAKQTRQRQTRSLLVESLEDRRLLTNNDDLEIFQSSSNSTIYEPHLIYSPSAIPQTVYGLFIAGVEWEGGQVQIQFGGQTQYSSDYSLDYNLGPGPYPWIYIVSFDAPTNILTLDTVHGTFSLAFSVTALQDNVEPGVTGESESELITMSWVPGQSDVKGSASMNIHDLKKGVKF